jgi:transposase
MQARVITHHWKRKESLLGLKRQAERDGQTRVARRLHAIVLNMDGHSSGKIATVLDVARSNVSQWLANYERDGLEALMEGHRCGRPSGLVSAHLKSLKDIIDSGPVAYGFTGGVWTSAMVTRVIAEEFGRTYHPGHVRKILYALDYSVQRPKRLLARADSGKRRRWVRSTYPDIKKKPARSVRR